MRAGINGITLWKPSSTELLDTAEQGARYLSNFETCSMPGTQCALHATCAKAGIYAQLQLLHISTPLSQSSAVQAREQPSIQWRL